MTELNPIIKMEARNLNFHYGANDALKNINVAVKERQITALIGSLKAAALWSEVSERLHANALGPTLRQRLCIARELAGQPEVTLMDELCSVLELALCFRT